jgi:hypothetical protein
MKMIINTLTLKTLPYFVIAILLVFSITVVVEIHDINAEVEDLKTIVTELKKVKS